MILETILAIPVWAFYSVAALALGMTALRAFPSIKSDAVPYSGLSLSLGLGLLGAIWSIFASMPNGLQSYSVLIVLGLALLSGWKDVWHLVLNINYKNLIPTDKRLRWISFPLIGMLAIAPVLCWYPLGTDALAFYFAQAKIVAYNHQFVPLPGYESFSQIPLPAEYTYSALILIGGELAARMITATEVWACALLIVSLASACGAGIAGRWFALLMLFTSTSVTLLMSDGKTDLYGGMLGFATLYVFLTSRDLSLRFIVLMGVLTGLSVFSKLSFLPILVAMLPLLLLWRYICVEQKMSAALLKTLKSGAIISVCVGGIMLLLVLKNWLAYQEPLAPFLILGDKKYDNITSQVWFSPEVTAWILKTFPFVWTFGQYPMQHGNLSPLVWAALPAFFLVNWKKLQWRTDPAIALASVGCVGMIVWGVFFSSIIAPRYIFPALFAFVPLSVRGLESLWNYIETRKLKNGFALILALFAFVAFVYQMPQFKNGLRAAVKGYDKSHVGYVWEGLQAAETIASEESRILLVGWERSPFSGKALSCLVSHNEIGINMILSKITPPQKYWEDIYRSGTNVMVVNEVGRKDFVDKIDIKQKPSWLNIERKEINKFYALYILTPQKGAPAQEKRCARNDKGIWQTTSNVVENNG